MSTNTPTRTRRTALAATILAGGLGALLPLAAAHADDAPGSSSTTFTTTGAAQQFVVPDHVGVLHVTARGAAGGTLDDTAHGGLGAEIVADIPVGPSRSVHAGDHLVVVVGGPGSGRGEPGFNGGGASVFTNDGSGPAYGSSGGGGGGATDLRLPRGDLADRIVVAGGGGGSGYDYADGGNAGSDAPYGLYGRGGQAGTESAGGAGAMEDRTDDEGTFGQGGNGGTLEYHYPLLPFPGGAGGGGWYGGGGGQAPLDGYGTFSTGGGGGSSHVIEEGTLVSSTSTGEPASLTISWTVDEAAPMIGATADITTTATSASGAQVSFSTPTATDNLDGVVPVSCDGQSGAIFPVGTSTVTCTAIDAAQNAATSTFRITVNPQPAAPSSTKADIKVDVTGPTTVKKGATVTYKVTVTNTGPATATNVDAILAVSGLNKVSGTAGAKQGSVRVLFSTISGLRWNIPAIAAGRSVSFEVRGTAPTRSATISVVGAALSKATDPNLSNNLDTVCTPVR